MKFNKRLITTLTAAVLAVPVISSTQGSVSVNNTVQAAKAKKSKYKYTKLKNLHNVILWGPYRWKTPVNLNKVGMFSDPGLGSSQIEYATLEGYTHFKGKKYYYSVDPYFGTKEFINPVSLRKPTVYRVKSPIKVYYLVGAKSSKNGNIVNRTSSNLALLPTGKTLSAGDTVGIFSYMKPYTINKVDDESKGKGNIRSIANKSLTIKLLNGPTETVRGGKYLEVMLDDGQFYVIKQSDMNKLSKGGSGKKYLNIKKMEQKQKAFAADYNMEHKKKKMIYGGLSTKQ